MTLDEIIQRYGVAVSKSLLPEIRVWLAELTAAERQQQGKSDTELMKLHCLQLFSAGELEDVPRIWAAKTSSMDADASIDIQLLCGAGLEATKQFLAIGSIDSHNQQALERIKQCEREGDFIEFSPQQILSEYSDYFQSQLWIFDANIAISSKSQLRAKYARWEKDEDIALMESARTNSVRAQDRFVLEPEKRENARSIKAYADEGPEPRAYILDQLRQAYKEAGMCTN